MRKGTPVPVGEPRDRTILGRLYYSAFLALREAVRVRYGKPRFEVRHEDLRRKLKDCADDDVSQAGERLAQLFQWRKRADYNLSDSVPPTIVPLMYLNAKTILDNVATVTPKLPLDIPEWS